MTNTGVRIVPGCACSTTQESSWAEVRQMTRFRDIELHAPTGNELGCKGWVQEAALRMLHNNLDPEVAENPRELVVYGGIGRAARDWESFDAIVETLKRLEN